MLVLVLVLVLVLLLVLVRRYRGTTCARFWLQDTSAAAEPRAKVSRGGLAWALRAIVVDHLNLSRVAASLGVAWHTANDAVLAEGHRRLINDPARFDGVAVLRVDEHVWRHTRLGDKYATVISDLTPARDGTGRARLLGMVPGRSKQVFKSWLTERPPQWRDGIEVVAMDGFTGFKTAAAEELPDAVAVMDPFHVVRLAGDALDQCRRRIQQQLPGHRGRGRGDLGRLPAHEHRLPTRRPRRWPQHKSRSTKTYPLTYPLANLAGGYRQTEYLVPAAAFVSMIVPLIVFFSLQRYFVRGLLAGSTKG